MQVGLWALYRKSSLFTFHSANLNENSMRLGRLFQYREFSIRSLISALGRPWKVGFAYINLHMVESSVTFCMFPLNIHTVVSSQKSVLFFFDVFILFYLNLYMCFGHLARFCLIFCRRQGQQGPLH